jgi:hypothetical protein
MVGFDHRDRPVDEAERVGCRVVVCSVMQAVVEGASRLLEFCALPAGGRDELCNRGARGRRCRGEFHGTIRDTARHHDLCTVNGTMSVSGRSRHAGRGVVKDAPASLVRRRTELPLQEAALGAERAPDRYLVMRPIVTSRVQRAHAGGVPGVAARCAVIALRHGVSFLVSRSGLDVVGSGRLRARRLHARRPVAAGARRARTDLVPALRRRLAVVVSTRRSRTSPIVRSRALGSRRSTWSWTWYRFRRPSRCLTT